MPWFKGSNKITCNDITYNIPLPNTPPVIGICLDGTSPNHLAGLEMPHFWSGSYRDAHAFIPTVTNTNNVSIITGVAPSVHGIVGNTILESEEKKEKGN